MKSVLLLLGCLWSFLYCPSLSKVLKNVRNYLYTGYYRRLFKSFGSNSIIKHPFSYARGLEYVIIGNKSSIGAHVELTAWDAYKGQKFTPEIIIGDGTSIRDYSHITAIQSIRIGNGVLTGPNILITDNAHGASIVELLDMPPQARPLHSKGPVVIEDNVWIGEKSSIMPGVHIGKGAIIAANSVVTHDIPSYCVAAGIPAKVIKVIRNYN